VKFIHAADLHLDSPLTGLVRHDAAPVERIRGATREALRALVRLALDEAVDLVVLAGDIYDGNWKDFHTGLFFREQLVSLCDAGIAVVIIHGNHDAESVVSKAVPPVSGVTVLDSKACQTLVIDTLGVALHGQSFATREVTEDLAADYPDALPGLFNIGLLHTSLTGRDGHGSYAPTSLATLLSKGYDYFALGHVHTREIVQESQPRIVFPGNLQGRHIRETGAKGCELITVEDGAIVDTRFIALDVVRWHRLDVDVSGLDSLDALVRAFTAIVDERLDGRDERLHAARVRLHGVSALSRIEAEQPGTLAAAIQAATQDLSGTELWLEKVQIALQSPISRDALGERDDAPGEVVRLVDDLIADEAVLQSWFANAIGDMKKLPPTIGDADPHAYSLEAIRECLQAAEATVLTSLGEDETETLSQ